MKKLILGVMIISLWSCTKPVNCSGTVYSQSHKPLSGVTVKFNIYNTASSYPTTYKECITDANGNYYFSEKIRKKTYIKIECRCDSGYAVGGWGRGNELNGQRVDLHLEK